MTSGRRPSLLPTTALVAVVAVVLAVASHLGALPSPPASGTAASVLTPVELAGPAPAGADVVAADDEGAARRAAPVLGVVLVAVAAAVLATSTARRGLVRAPVPAASRPTGARGGRRAPPA